MAPSAIITEAFTPLCYIKDKDDFTKEEINVFERIVTLRIPYRLLLVESRYLSVHEWRGFKAKVRTFVSVCVFCNKQELRTRYKDNATLRDGM